MFIERWPEDMAPAPTERNVLTGACKEDISLRWSYQEFHLAPWSINIGALRDL